MKAALYCRLSEEDKNKTASACDSESIQNQKALLTAYAKENAFEIYHIYSDDDYAGTDRNRPAFNALLKDAENKKFDVILCKTLSRFTREITLVEEYIHHLFPLWGIRFISIVDHTDSADYTNKKSRQLNGLINEWYLEDMSESIRSVLIHKRKQGLHIGSFALYGYQKDPLRKGHLLIDEEAAATVREVFTLFSQGYGKTAIARILNEKNIPNPTEYKRRKGLRYQAPPSKQSTLWKYPAIDSMLKNEIYRGHMVQGKYGSTSYKTKQNKPRPHEDWYMVPNTHEAIIDADLWESVQTILTQRAKPFQSGTIGLFTGKARCMTCGYLLRSSKSKGKYYLQCPNHHVSKNACQGAFIAVSRLEEIVRKEIETLSAQYLSSDILCQSISITPKILIKKKEISKKIIEYQKKEEDYLRAAQNLYLDKTKGNISESLFSEWLTEFTKKANEAHAMILQNRLALENYDRLLQTEGHAIAENPFHPERCTRPIIDALIESIFVGKRISGTRTVPIEIHWNF